MSRVTVLCERESSRRVVVSSCYRRDLGYVVNRPFHNDAIAIAGYAAGFDASARISSCFRTTLQQVLLENRARTVLGVRSMARKRRTSLHLRQLKMRGRQEAGWKGKGRPPMWINPDSVRQMAEAGHSDQAIAADFEVDVDTLRARCAEALAQGRARLLTMLQDALYDFAMEGHWPAFKLAVELFTPQDPPAGVTIPTPRLPLDHKRAVALRMGLVEWALSGYWPALHFALEFFEPDEFIVGRRRPITSREVLERRLLRFFGRERTWQRVVAPRLSTTGRKKRNPLGKKPLRANRMEALGRVWCAHHGISAEAGAAALDPEQEASLAEIEARMAWVHAELARVKEEQKGWREPIHPPTIQTCGFAPENVVEMMVAKVENGGELTDEDMKLLDARSREISDALREIEEQRKLCQEANAQGTE